MRAPSNDNAIDCPRLALVRRVALADQRRLMRAKPPPRQSGDGRICQDPTTAYAAPAEPTRNEQEQLMDDRHSAPLRQRNTRTVSTKLGVG